MTAKDEQCLKLGRLHQKLNDSSRLWNLARGNLDNYQNLFAALAHGIEVYAKEVDHVLHSSWQHDQLILLADKLPDGPTIVAAVKEYRDQAKHIKDLQEQIGKP